MTELMMKINVRGHKKVLKNLDVLNAIYMDVIDSGVTYFLEEYARAANTNLIKRMEGKENPTTSHGDVQTPIIDPADDLASWHLTTLERAGNRIVKKMENVSEHAAVVEFGKKGKIYPKNSGYRTGAIGAENYGGMLYLGLSWGGNPVYKPWVEGQAGYGYATEALHDQAFMRAQVNFMRKRFYKNITRAFNL